MTSIEAIVRWVVVLLLLRFLSGVGCKKLLGRSLEFLGIPLTILVAVYLYWIWGTFFQLPSGWLVQFRVPEIVTLGIAVYALWWVGRVAPFEESPSEKKSWMAEGVFVGTFLLALLIRSWTPDITGTEKFPDFAIFQSVLWDSSFPPGDRWLSGVPLNYYYFSQLLFVPLVRLSGVSPEFGVNLAVATVFALTAAVSFALGSTFSRRVKVGLFAALGTVLLANWAWVGQWIGTGRFFWWDSSRAIENTITEFPFFSFLLGDFHPHFTSLPWLGATLGLIWIVRSRLASSASKRSLVALGLLTALVIGSHYPMNPWGLPFVAGFAALFWNGKPSRKTLALTALIGVGAFLLFCPFWFAYESPVSGIHWVDRSIRSHAGQFLLHWGLFFLPLIWLIVLSWRGLLRERTWIVVTVTALVGALLGWSSAFVMGLAGLLWLTKGIDLKRLEDLLIVMVLGTIFFCELISLDATYGPKLLRLNTVFKFYTISWWSLALAIPLLLHREREQILARKRTSVALLVVALLLSLFYPVEGTRSRLGGVFPPATLDGMHFWEREFPDERGLVDWLRKRPASDVIWEAEGPAYGPYGRMSAFSGRAALLGWANHEGVWRRKGWDLVRPRQEEVRRLNERPTPRRLGEFVSKYGLNWIVVASLEKRDYSSQLLTLLKRLPVAFQTSTGVIYSAAPAMAWRSLPANSTE